jgi:AraC-like DNA-binding protein
LTGLFDAYPENDERAMVFVNMFISKAKKENKPSKLIAGYEEALYYSRSVEKKIKYADSAVAVAHLMNDPDMISTSHLKRGIVFYYNKRDYRKALQEYLTAFKSARNTEDLYLFNKILYHLGMVRSYLGYCQEAAAHFNEAACYYEKYRSANDDPIIFSNYEHGYLNSIYRLSACYRNLRSYKKEDSLVQIGIKRSNNSVAFAQGQTAAAEKYLKSAEQILKDKEDFAMLATVDFYLGKLNFINGRRKESLVYLKKVDSILDKFNLVTPEAVNSYKYLIQDAKEKGDDRLQLYYTNKLLQADSLLIADFALLTTQIYREYQVDRLNESRDKLVRKHKYGSALSSLVMIVGMLVFYFFVIRYRKKEKLLTIRYNELLEKLKKADEASRESVEISHHTIKSIYSDELVEEIKKNLKIFEDKKQFLRKDLKLPDVARLIKSHRSALSFVLNEHMDTSFTQYIKVLRIKYITKQMMDNKLYLRYSMDTLAAECGMKNRNVFSNHFLEINGIRPTDFVRKRRRELDMT